MKILYVVVAYGAEVFGGAETHCRMMATRMAERGHEVDVATSCATTYYDWANKYEPGTSSLDGVTLHRFPVTAPRDHRRFDPLSQRVLGGHKPLPLFLQQKWLEQQGPALLGYEDWLWDHARDYDAVVFFTYLYSPTTNGLPLVSGRVPAVIHTLAHDEPPFYLPVFDAVFKLPTAFAFSVEEEAQLVRRRAHPSALQSIVGIGADLDMTGDGDRFRSAYDVTDPYVVCVGRLDPQKGSDELYEMFAAYKERNPGPLKLVLVGEPVKPIEPNRHVVVTGFVDKQMRDDAMAGAIASLHPSYFESFSMALTEAWSLRKPAIVNGHCNVFLGQAKRSGGALPYFGFAEFEAALDMVTQEEAVAKRLGGSGRAYAERRYRWETVMERYERLLTRAPAI